VTMQVALGLHNASNITVVLLKKKLNNILISCRFDSSSDNAIACATSNANSSPNTVKCLPCNYPECDNCDALRAEGIDGSFRLITVCRNRVVVELLQKDCVLQHQYGVENHRTSKKT
jgi:hypothetical protein